VTGFNDVSFAQQYTDYGAGAGSLHQQEETLRPWPCRVTRVDHDQHVLSVLNIHTGIVFDTVSKFPITGSSNESNHIELPEVGAAGLAVYTSFQQGYVKVAVICWVPSDIDSNLDAVAHRPQQKLEGWSTRRRGLHRKSFPGLTSRTTSAGLHEMDGQGWERWAEDLSHDKLDPDRRQWTRITSRSVNYNDAGVQFAGPVHRFGADKGIVPEEILPDGTKRQIVYLKEKKKIEERYLDGMLDMLPVSEILQKVQEFALDHPIPYEILESDLLDDMLGTKRELWKRTAKVTQADEVQRDDQAFLTDQKLDHPHDKSKKPVGPTRKEGSTPRRRAWIIEKSQGTLVGYNRWDKSTFGRILKPVLWPLTKAGRFGTNVESGHLPVEFSDDHVETRLAATAHFVRFPFEYNTTRVDVTKEGLVQMEIGATIPRENIVWDNPKYEHPWGAGRSLEAHLVGSAKVVVGKNRDEEDSLDLTTLGQVVLRLGADDSALLSDGRTLSTQIREKSDAVMPRDLQVWKKAKLVPGDCGDLENKTGAENVSMRAATDGGVFLRLGARNEQAKRRHLKNGYSDGPGAKQDPPGQGSRSRTKGRPTYGAGDSPYKFNDLRAAAKPVTGLVPYFWSGDPVKDMDVHGLSLDVHAVRDIFLRVGKNRLMDQSILLDLEGGIVAIVGKDKTGRSLTGSLLGGIELTVGSNAKGQGVQLEIIGDVNMAIKGNWHVHATGDIVFDAMGNIINIAHKEAITKAVNIRQAALTQHVTEAPDIVHNQGGFADTGD
jgi:hypothetical protein